MNAVERLAVTELVSEGPEEVVLLVRREIGEDFVDVLLDADLLDWPPRPPFREFERHRAPHLAWEASVFSARRVERRETRSSCRS